MVDLDDECVPSLLPDLFLLLWLDHGYAGSLCSLVRLPVSLENFSIRSKYLGFMYLAGMLCLETGDLDLERPRYVHLARLLDLELDLERDLALDLERDRRELRTELALYPRWEREYLEFETLSLLPLFVLLEPEVCFRVLPFPLQSLVRCTA